MNGDGLPFSPFDIKNRYNKPFIAEKQMDMIPSSAVAKTDHHFRIGLSYDLPDQLQIQWDIDLSPGTQIAH